MLRLSLRRIKTKFSSLNHISKRTLVDDLSEPNLSYEFGESNFAFKHSPLTIGNLLKRSCHLNPDHLAFVSCHQNIEKTYRQFDMDVDQLAWALYSIGCRNGSLVGIMAVNCYEWIVTQFATARLGCILVAINPGYKEKEVFNCLNLFKVDTLIMNQRFKRTNHCQILENIAPGIITKANGFQVENEKLPILKRLIVLDDIEKNEDNLKVAPENLIRFSQMMSMEIDQEKRDDFLKEISTPQFDDIVTIQFTSGTTGIPKGAMSTHFNMLQNIQFVSNALFQGLGLKPEDEKLVVCVPNPLYHAFGLVLGSSTNVYLHGTMVLPAPIPDKNATIRAIEKYRCNFLYGTPTMWSDLIEEIKKDKKDQNETFTGLSSLKRGVMSGASCPPTLVEKTLKDIPSLENILIPYGSTELGPVATTTTINDLRHHQINSVGKPIPFVEVKIKDLKTGRTVERGQKGEICIRSHGTFPGYFEQFDKTNEVIDNRFWYHTGDVGFLDQHGYLFVSGRIKEMIIRGGENIYPKEVEDLILEFVDSIEDIHVVGVPDERFGEELVAYIKFKDNLNEKQLFKNENELKEFLKTKISHFKVPKHIKFVEDFPRTSTGKVKKMDIKQLALKEFK